MKVFVTGGCGFLGSHVCEYWVKKGDEAVSFDNLTKHELKRTGYSVEAARMYNWNVLDKMGVQLVKGDLRNYEEVLKAAKDCDYIVHTAAQPAMTYAIENPRFDLENNVIGTFNCLEAARKYDIPIVSCASIHVYGPAINDSLTEGETRYLRDPVAIDEEHPIVKGTLTPLHASKRAAELYVETYIHTYGLKAASFRLTGIYGTRQFGGEDHGWVANFTIRTILGIPLTIYGTGKQTRDIIYATDVARAFDAFYNKPVSGIYNIGGGEKTMISLIECIELIEKVTGIKPVVKYGPVRLGDLFYFVCDITKARK
ncbi:MAG: NAD-dependent epimerase/dehydratase family protein, partial [Candidatus Helarchaeales archaeon]